jgi:hypothetical protein
VVRDTVCCADNQHCSSCCLLRFFAAEAALRASFAANRFMAALSSACTSCRCLHRARNEYYSTAYRLRLVRAKRAGSAASLVVRERTLPGSGESSMTSVLYMYLLLQPATGHSPSDPSCPLLSCTSCILHHHACQISHAQLQSRDSGMPMDETYARASTCPQGFSRTSLFLSKAFRVHGHCML